MTGSGGSGGLERRLSCRRLGSGGLERRFLAADWERRLSCRRLGRATFLSPSRPPPPWLHRSSTTKGRRSGPRRTLSRAAKLDALSGIRGGRGTTPPLVFAIGFSVQGGGIAQLEEHLLCKQGVVGSNPITSTRFYIQRHLTKFVQKTNKDDCWLDESAQPGYSPIQ